MNSLEQSPNFIPIINDNPNDNFQNSTPLNIIVPNPPTIEVRDYVRKNRDGKWPTKPANSFMLYRKAYLEELKQKNLKLPMHNVSKLVGSSWKKEKKSVKAAYKNLATEIEKRLLSLRNRNAISDQDIYFYNHGRLTSEEFKDLYFTTNSVNPATINFPSSPSSSCPLESRQTDSNIGNNDKNDLSDDNNCDNVQLNHNQGFTQQQQQNFGNNYRPLSIPNSGYAASVTRLVNINNHYDNNNDDTLGQQEKLYNSINNYSLPSIKNDGLSVYKFNSSSDIGLIAATPSESIVAANFLFNKYQNFNNYNTNEDGNNTNDGFNNTVNGNNNANDFNNNNDFGVINGNNDYLNNNNSGDNSNSNNDFSYLYYHFP